MAMHYLLSKNLQRFLVSVVECALAFFPRKLAGLRPKRHLQWEEAAEKDELPEEQQHRLVWDDASVDDGAPEQMTGREMEILVQFFELPSLDSDVLRVLCASFRASGVIQYAPFEELMELLRAETLLIL